MLLLLKSVWSVVGISVSFKCEHLLVTLTANGECADVLQRNIVLELLSHSGTHYDRMSSLFGDCFQSTGCVHGITDEEIAAGPSFPTAWSRFLSWTETLLNNAVKETVRAAEAASIRVR